MEQVTIETSYIPVVKKGWRTGFDTRIMVMRLHDIRHTFSILLLNNGESPVYVKEQLGHSSIKMTVDIYGHLIPGANR